MASIGEATESLSSLPQFAAQVVEMVQAMLLVFCPCCRRFVFNQSPSTCISVSCMSVVVGFIPGPFFVEVVVGVLEDLFFFALCLLQSASEFEVVAASVKGYVPGPGKVVSSDDKLKAYVALQGL